MNAADFSNKSKWASTDKNIAPTLIMIRLKIFFDISIYFNSFYQALGNSLDV